MAIATVALWLASLLLTVTFLSLVSAMGPSGTFLALRRPEHIHFRVHLAHRAGNAAQIPRRDRTDVAAFAQPALA